MWCDHGKLGHVKKSKSKSYGTAFLSRSSGLESMYRKTRPKAPEKKLKGS